MCKKKKSGFIFNPKTNDQDISVFRVFTYQVHFILIKHFKCSDCVSTFGNVLPFVYTNHGRIVGSNISQGKLKQII